MKNQQDKYCRNCHYPLSAKAKYCSKCSQKYTTGKVSVGHFVQEFLEDHLNFDSKLIKTAFALIIPGKLTEEYFKGRHKRFASPLRLFLVTALVFIASISIDFSVNELENKDLIIFQKEMTRKKFFQQFDGLQNQVKDQYNTTIVDNALDSLTSKVRPLLIFDDTLRISNSLDIEFLPFLKVPNIAKVDLLTKAPEEIAAMYSNGNNFWYQFFFTQALKLYLSGGSLVNYIFSKLTWSILFMMPFLALILKLLYIRRQRFYVEHLIFSFHFHSFLFLLISFAILFFNFLPTPLFVGIIFYIFVHLFLSMKRVYQQGNGKTFLKFLMLYVSYLFLITVVGLLTLLLSFIFF